MITPNDTAQRKWVLQEREPLPTVKEWLSQLPKGYRESALASIGAFQHERVDSMAAAIVRLQWHSMREGAWAWDMVYAHYAKEPRPLRIVEYKLESVELSEHLPNPYKP